MTKVKDILRIEYLAADKQDTLIRVNSIIKDEAFSEVLIFDKKQLIGVFSPSRASMITPSKENMEQMRIGKLVTPIDTLDEETELDELLIKMLGTGCNLIPISKGGSVIGIVHLFDLLDAVKFEFDGLKVSDIELQKPVELFEDERIGKAIHILHENINNTILVMGKGNSPAGILNHYDLLRNLRLGHANEDRKNGKGYKFERDDMLTSPISDFIKRKSFVSVNSKDTILDVIKRFKANNVTSLVVKDLSSLIRSEDILNHLKQSQMVQPRAVDFVGLHDLKIDDSTTASIKDAAQRSLEKINDIVQHDAILKVHIKRHFAAHENKRHKYSVVLHLEYPGNHLSIDNVSDWDLKYAVKMAIKELENRINRIFNTNGTEQRILHDPITTIKTAHQY